MMGLKKLCGDDAGAHLVEYVVLVGVIALVGVAGFQTFGRALQKRIETQANQVESIGCDPPVPLSDTRATLHVRKGHVAAGGRNRSDHVEVSFPIVKQGMDPKGLH